MIKGWWYNWKHPKGVHPWRWRFIRWWIIVFSILVIYSLYEIRNLGVSNKHRISDIQASRLISCQSTYEGVRQVFKPFFPPAGHRTAKQSHDLKVFNKTVNNLKKRCPKQVSSNNGLQKERNGRVYKTTHSN